MSPISDTRVSHTCPTPQPRKLMPASAGGESAGAPLRGLLSRPVLPQLRRHGCTQEGLQHALPSGTCATPPSDTLHPISYTRHPTPYTLHFSVPTPYTCQSSTLNHLNAVTCNRPATALPPPTRRHLYPQTAGSRFPHPRYSSHPFDTLHLHPLASAASSSLTVAATLLPTYASAYAPVIWSLTKPWISASLISC